MTESETDDLRQRRHLRILVTFGILTACLLSILLLIVCVYLPRKDRREYNALRATIARDLPVSFDNDIRLDAIGANGPDGVNVNGELLCPAFSARVAYARYLRQLTLDNQLRESVRFSLMKSLSGWFEKALEYDAAITFNISYPGVKTLSIRITPQDYRDFKATLEEKEADLRRHEEKAAAMLDSLISRQRSLMTSDARSAGLPPMPKGVSLKDITLTETCLTYVFEIDEDVTTPIECSDGFHESGNRLGAAYVEGKISKENPLFIPVLNSGLDICFKAVGSRTGYTLEHTVLTASEATAILRDDYLSD